MVAQCRWMLDDVKGDLGRRIAIGFELQSARAAAVCRGNRPPLVRSVRLGARVQGSVVEERPARSLLVRLRKEWGGGQAPPRAYGSELEAEAEQRFTDILLQLPQGVDVDEAPARRGRGSRDADGSRNKKAD